MPANYCQTSSAIDHNWSAIPTRRSRQASRRRQRSGMFRVARESPSDLTSYRAHQVSVVAEIDRLQDSLFKRTGRSDGPERRLHGIDHVTSRSDLVAHLAPPRACSDGFDRWRTGISRWRRRRACRLRNRRFPPLVSARAPRRRRGTRLRRGSLATDCGPETLQRWDRLRGEDNRREAHDAAIAGRARVFGADRPAGLQKARKGAACGVANIETGASDAILAAFPRTNESLCEVIRTERQSFLGFRACGLMKSGRTIVPLPPKGEDRWFESPREFAVRPSFRSSRGPTSLGFVTSATITPVSRRTRRLTAAGVEPGPLNCARTPQSGLRRRRAIRSLGSDDGIGDHIQLDVEIPTSRHDLSVMD